MRVRYTYLDRQYEKLRAELLDAIDSIFSRSAFILRAEVSAFERRIAKMLGVREAIGGNSGTDALNLGIRALGFPVGSEIITVGHTFVSTISAIVHAGLTPILVDINDRDFNIAPAAVAASVTHNTRAILVVHMNGRVCDMTAIERISRDHDLLVLEDAAQAIGARFKGTAAGAFGKSAAFSLHPMKVLGCAGDGGFIATNDQNLAETLRAMRNLGQGEKGIHAYHAFNSRLDTMQAAICMVKIHHLHDWIARRRLLAQRYDIALADFEGILRPFTPNSGNHFDVYSSYVIRSRKRDELRAHLEAHGVETMVAWSLPIHRQDGLDLERFSLPVTDRISHEVLSLPIDPEMSDDEQDHVVGSIRQFNW